MNKLVIGVCGKPCSGKSTFLKLLCPKSVDIIDCDKMCKDILGEYAYEIRVMLGTANPKDVADIIFHDKEKYDQYVKFIWGILKQNIDKEIKESTSDNVILDAPLLLESGMDKMCDVVIQFTANPLTRAKWAAKRGWNSDELKRRDAYFTK